MNIEHRLFLQVLSQAIGDHKGNMILRHQFMSAYEQACLWVEANGYGVCTDDGAVLHADPWDVFIDSADLEPHGQAVKPEAVCGEPGCVDGMIASLIDPSLDHPCPKCRPAKKESR